MALFPSSFDEYQKISNFVEEVKKKEKDKLKWNKWTFLGIYTFLGVTFPLVGFLMVFGYKMAQYYASLFN